MMRSLAALCILIQLAACGPVPRASSGDILVIGDSVLAWNRGSGADIGAVIGTALDRQVVNRATLGAQVRTGSLGAIGRLSIPRQLAPGPWTWVVMNGGANDLGFSCGCTRCETEIDSLISENAATGAIPNLISAARRQGAQVLWVGYYQAPQSRSFQGCRPGLVELERRIAAFAQRQDGVFFVDAEAVIDPARSGLLAPDATHPSVAGSALIGQFLAREIRARTLP